ncbi:MAG: anion permease [Candidatus Omnitrophica bacterium]|nr:anion permease [Candidatus Omnitrophota bacterium]MCM8808098.1 anion permease [Candidatus Omnitrophota bacterium]
MIFIFTLLFSFYMGWSMGANDAANCVGADIGSGVMKVREGIIITIFFSFLGAILLGSNVIKTIGKGVVPLDILPYDVAILISLTALFGASTWVTIATYKKIPVSTSHSIVGAVAGAGLAFSTPIYWYKIVQIVICWILTPVGSAIISFLIFPIIKFIFSLKPVKKIEKQLVIIFIYLTSAYLAFSWGANDVANATGVLIGTGRITPKLASLIGAIAIAIGVSTWGYKVIETVGFNIIRLSPLMTIAAEIGSSLNVHLYTHLGIPVSTSHSIVGAIWGIGLYQGIKAINLKIAKEIILTWAITPLFSGIISYVVTKLILIFIGG